MMSTNGAIGLKNIKFAWVFLVLFTVFGAFLEVKLLDEEWAAQFDLPKRQLWRSTHVHGLLLAFLNMFYGLMIDNANLSDKQKRAGSAHAILGAVVLPLSLLFAGFFPLARYLAPVGGLAVIFAGALIAYGYLKK